MDDPKVKLFCDLVDALTPVPDMAVLLGVPESDLREVLDDPGNPLSAAYRRRKAMALLDVRRADIQRAKDGDAAAAERVRFYLERMEMDE